MDSPFRQVGLALLAALAILAAPDSTGAGIDFAVEDAETGLALGRDGGSFRAVSGERLRFVPSGVQGSIAWSFGDGSSSAEPQPVHSYTTNVDATYVVSLASGGETRGTSLLVAGTLGPPLTGAYTYRYADGGTVATAGVAWNRAVRFTASDEADGYAWDFGDGASATGSPVDHAFVGVGTFRVRLTVTKAGLPLLTTPSPVPFTVLPAPARPQWVVPGIAYADGLGGAFWRSDVTFVNPNASESIALSLAFLDGRQPAATESLRWNPLALAPLQSVTLTNVLASPPFSLPRGAFGALIVRGDAVPSEPTITARTYSGIGGTYGLSSAGTSTALGLTPDAAEGQDLLIGLRETAAHYTNLGLANLQGDAASAEILFFDAAGAPLGGTVRVDLPAFGVRQLTHVLSAAPPLGAGYAGSVDDFTASVTLLSGTGIAPYATVIDSRSKDPVFVTPTSRPASSYRLPGVVRASGRNGTSWRSDVVLSNPTSSPRRVIVAFSYQTAASGRSSSVKTLALGPKESFVANDFVKSWLELPEGDTTSYVNSFVDVSPAADDAGGGPLLVFGRTYNDQPAGEVGLGIPGFTAEAGASADGMNRRLVVAGLRSNDAYRSNIAIFLLPSRSSAAGAKADVKVYDASGRLLATRHATLDPIASVVQLNDDDLFGGLPGPKDDLTVIVDGLSGAAVAAYATVIDQISGDASFVAGQPAP